MKQVKPKRIKKSVSFTKDTTSIKNFVITNHLSDEEYNKILSKIDNNETYFSAFFIFTDEDKYFCIKAPYEFYKFDSFKELLGYIEDKYRVHKSNLSQFDSSIDTQRRILKKVQDMEDSGSLHGFISWMNYLYKAYGFAGNEGPRGPSNLPNIFAYPDTFYKNSRIMKYKWGDGYLAPFAFKGYDFAFEYDKYERKIYLRYVANEDEKERYENQKVHTSGALAELIELFHDQYPDTLNTIYHVYHYFD